MTYSFNGIGTEYWGQRETEPDGSYIATKFFCIVVPLIPLASYRVRPLTDVKYHFGGKSQQLEIKQVPMNWRQVGNVYLCELAILICAPFAIWAYHRLF